MLVDSEKDNCERFGERGVDDLRLVRFFNRIVWKV